MQAEEMRMISMMCRKALHDGILNGLLRDRIGVEDIENHVGETRMRWLGHLKRIDETREAYASMIPKIETSEDDAAEEWSTLVNWEEDSAIKAEQRSSSC